MDISCLWQDFMIVSISLFLPLSLRSSVFFHFLSLSFIFSLSFSVSLSDCVANCDDGYFMFGARFHDESPARGSNFKKNDVYYLMILFILTNTYFHQTGIVVIPEIYVSEVPL